MIIFLYGQDGYRLSKKAGEIIDEYKQRKKGLNFSVFDAQSDDQKQFFISLRQGTLFSEKKFFLVKNPVSNKDFKETFLDQATEIAKLDHNIILCQEGKVLKADRLLNAVKKIGKLQEFNLLEGKDLIDWISEEFQRANRPVSREIALFIADRIGNDLWRIANEIQKLAHRIQGRQLTISDIEENISNNPETNIFQTIDALAGRNKTQALILVKEHLAKGDHPLYLLAMIAGQFRNLMMVKAAGGSGDLARRLGIHPYVVSKSVKQALKFSQNELEEICRKIFHSDFAIKTGKIDPETGLDLLIAQI